MSTARAPSQIGLTQRDVANDLLISLSSSSQTAPNYWLNPINGVNYSVAVQTPQYKIDSLDALKQSPISAGKLAQPQLLENLAPITRSDSAGGDLPLRGRAGLRRLRQRPGPRPRRRRRRRPENRRSIQARRQPPTPRPRPTPSWTKLYDKFSQAARRPTPDSVLPTGSQIIVRGQVASMTSAYTGLGIGILFAIGLVYFLMVVNFQSWLDPFIIIMALPGALAGIV